MRGLFTRVVIAVAFSAVAAERADKKASSPAKIESGFEDVVIETAVSWGCRCKLETATAMLYVG